MYYKYYSRVVVKNEFRLEFLLVPHSNLFYWLIGLTSVLKYLEVGVYMLCNMYRSDYHVQAEDYPIDAFVFYYCFPSYSPLSRLNFQQGIRHQSWVLRLRTKLWSMWREVLSLLKSRGPAHQVMCQPYSGSLPDPHHRRGVMEILPAAQQNQAMTQVSL